MKKLMTMMGAVAMSFGLFADAEAWSSVKYDDALQAKDEGATGIVGFDDVGTTTDAIHWWIDGFEAGTIDQPAVVSNDTVLGKKYLKVETDKGSPMLRTLNAVEIKEVEEVKEASYAPVGITDHGLFIDTMVRMTGTVDAPAIDAQNKNKLLVWLQTIDADETEGIEGSTNLMVTCGLVGNLGVITPTNYVLNANVKVGDWVQLTIRADKGTDNVPAFKIFVNEQQVASVDGLDVFPSLIGGADTIALSAAGFDGTGDINYVNLLSENDAPDFAADPTYLTLTWDANVEAITIGGENVIEGQTSGYKYPITAFGADITAEITYATGYEKKSVTEGGVTDFEADGDTVSFKVAQYAPATLDIVSKPSRDEVALTIGDELVTEKFASIKEAIEYIVELGAEGSAITMQLKLDEEASDFGDFSQLSDVTIDLAGRSLTAAAPWTGAQDPIWGYSIIHNGSGCTLVIKDTVGGGSINGIDDVVAVLANDGEATLLESADATKQIKFNGDIYSLFDGEQNFGTLDIQGGKFIAPITSAGVTIPNDKTWSDGPGEDGFYTLVEKTDYVAQIGDNKYETLKDALDAATATDTVKLLANTTLDKYTLAKKVVLDLNGFDLSSSVPTGAWEVDGSRQIIKLIDGADLTINGTGSTVSGNIYIGVKNGSTSSLVLNGGTYVNDTNSKSELPVAEQATQACLQTLGTDRTAGTKTIVLNGCTFTAPGTPIYLAANADATFNNCTITGDQAVAMKGGTLTINGGTYTANGAENIPTAGRSNGIESSGAAIQIESNSAYSDISVEINDATVVSANAPAVYEYLGKGATRVKAIALQGGSYTAGGAYDAIILSEEMAAVPGLVDNVRNTAVFSTDVSAYCEEGYGTLWNEATQSWGVAPVVLPTATVKSIEEGDYAVAVQFDADNIGAGYDNWIAKFYLTSDVTIGADEVQLGGSYAGYESGAWIDKDFTCTAGEPVSVLAAVGLDDNITVKKVFEDIVSFKCGVKNVALKNDATFSLALVIVNPDDDTDVKTLCTIDNLEVEKKEESKEIKPGETATDIVADDEAGALAQVTIKPINDEAAAAGQADVIKGKATQDAETGKWTVEPVIDEQAAAFKAPDVVVADTLEQIVAGTDGAAVTVELPAAKVTPGLYYSVDVATELVGEGSTFVEGEHVLATGAGVSLTVTKPTGGKAFFKVSEHMAPTPANVGTQD